MITSRALMAKIPWPAGVKQGLVVGTKIPTIPTGFAYLVMPLAGSASMTPTLFWRSTSRRIKRILFLLLTLELNSPKRVSSTASFANGRQV